MRLCGELVFVDQPAEEVTAADAVELDHVGGRLIVARRQLAERWPLLERAVRPVLVCDAACSWLGGSREALQRRYRGAVVVPAAAAGSGAAVGCCRRALSLRFDRRAAAFIAATASARSTQLAESLDRGSFELAMRIVPIDWWAAQLPDRPPPAENLRT
jgi:hypothetical protein